MPGRKRNMKKQSEYSKAYNAQSYDRLYPFVRKGHKAEIQSVAESEGETLNEFIVKAIDERMDRIEREKSSGPWYRTEDAKTAINNLIDSKNRGSNEPNK